MIKTKWKIELSEEEKFEMRTCPIMSVNEWYRLADRALLEGDENRYKTYKKINEFLEHCEIWHERKYAIRYQPEIERYINESKDDKKSWNFEIIIAVLGLFFLSILLKKR